MLRLGQSEVTAQGYSHRLTPKGLGTQARGHAQSRRVAQGCSSLGAAPATHEPEPLLDVLPEVKPPEVVLARPVAVPVNPLELETPDPVPGPLVATEDAWPVEAPVEADVPVPSVSSG